jgi:hypothetical protein
MSGVAPRRCLGRSGEANTTLSQRLHPAERLGEHKQLGGSEELARRRRGHRRRMVVDPKGHNAAVGKVALATVRLGQAVDPLARMRRERLVRDLVPRVGRQPGVYHLLHERARLEHLGDRDRVRAVHPHPQMHCLGTAVSQPTIKRDRYRADRVLQERQKRR